MMLSELQPLITTTLLNRSRCNRAAVNCRTGVHERFLCSASKNNTVVECNGCQGDLKPNGVEKLYERIQKSTKQLNFGYDIGSPQHALQSNSNSNGSYSSSSSNSPPSYLSSVSLRKHRFDFFTSDEQASAGNIFRHRKDLSSFMSLPHRLLNPYQVKTADEGPHGNDETRSFIMTMLSAAGLQSVRCVICSADIIIYDMYPLIDGTFYLSPLRYTGTSALLHTTSLRADTRCAVAASSFFSLSPSKTSFMSQPASFSPPSSSFSFPSSPTYTSYSSTNSSFPSPPPYPSQSSSTLYINCICMHCMNRSTTGPTPQHKTLSCRSCRKVWDGSKLVIGEMYRYDVFAALTCCEARFSCTRCGLSLTEEANKCQFFSDFSRQIVCPWCSCEDYHFVKPLDEEFFLSSSPPGFG